MHLSKKLALGAGAAGLLGYAFPYKAFRSFESWIATYGGEMMEAHVTFLAVLIAVLLLFIRGRDQSPTKRMRAGAIVAGALACALVLLNLIDFNSSEIKRSELGLYVHVVAAGFALAAGILAKPSSG